MSNKVVDIESNFPHVVSEVICCKCCHRWISVRHYDTLLKHLECPNCNQSGAVIETGQDLSSMEV